MINKCLQCANLHIEKRQNKRNLITCSKCRGVCIIGDLDSEPLVQGCGAFQKMRVYKNRTCT
jgi:hypothetical protein